MDEIIEIKGLRKTYKKKITALDGMNLRVRENELLCLVGESGCGKTTLAKCLVHLTKPDSGTMLYKGTDITSGDKKTVSFVHSKVHLVFQNAESSLNPRFTIYDSLAEPFRLKQIKEPVVGVKVNDSLAHVGLEKELLSRYPHQLSGGQLQRIAIARAVALRPELLIADEITASQDVSVQAHIIRLLMELKRLLGMTLVFITHDMSLVRCIGDRVAVMYEGKIVEINDTQTLFAAPHHHHIKKLLHSMEELSLRPR